MKFRFQFAGGWLLAGMLAMAACGCAKQASEPTANADRPEKAPGPTKHATMRPAPRATELHEAEATRGEEKLSVGACSAFAQELRQAALAGDAAAFNRGLNWRGLFSEAMAGVDIDDATREGVMQELLKQAEGPGSFSHELVRVVHAGGDYRPMQIMAEGVRPRVLMRLILGNNGGVNYHEFRLQRDETGRVVANDFYVYFSGELMSQTIRRQFLHEVAASNRGLFSRLAGWDRDVVENVAKMGNMIQLMQSGDYAGGLKIYHELPESLQRDKGMLLFRLRAAGETGNDDYLAALEDLLRFYPDDPSSKLHAIDYYGLQQLHDQSLAALFELNEQVGGDPYLLALASSMHLQQGDYAAARQMAEQSLAGEPSLQLPYLVLLDCNVFAKDYDAAIQVMMRLDKELGVQFEDFEAIPAFADFVQSPQYREWVEGRVPIP